MTLIASSSDSSCPTLICSFFSADWSMRSVESRSFSCAFIASVMSARTLSANAPMRHLLDCMLYNSPAMSLDVRALLEQTGALLTGHFRLSSGLHSANYVQCALLLEDPRNAKAIGEALASRFRALGAQRIVAPAL